MIWPFLTRPPRPQPPPTRREWSAPDREAEHLVLARLAEETARTDPLTAARLLFAPLEPRETQ